MTRHAIIRYKDQWTEISLIKTTTTLLETRTHEMNNIFNLGQNIFFLLYLAISAVLGLSRVRGEGVVLIPELKTKIELMIFGYLCI